MNLTTKFRLRHGMRWRGVWPSFDEILNALANTLLAIVAVAALLVIYTLLDLRDQAADERIKVGQHQQMLSDCLAGKAVFVVNGQGARCRVEWIKVTQ